MIHFASFWLVSCFQSSCPRTHHSLTSGVGCRQTCTAMYQTDGKKDPPCSVLFPSGIPVALHRFTHTITSFSGRLFSPKCALATVVICDGDPRDVNGENCARASPSTFNTQIHPTLFLISPTSTRMREVRSSLLSPTTPLPYPFPHPTPDQDPSANPTTVHSVVHIRLDLVPSPLIHSTHIFSFSLSLSLSHRSCLLRSHNAPLPGEGAHTGGVRVPVDLANRVGRWTQAGYRFECPIPTRRRGIRTHENTLFYQRGMRRTAADHRRTMQTRCCEASRLCPGCQRVVGHLRELL